MAATKFWIPRTSSSIPIGSSSSCKGERPPSASLASSPDKASPMSARASPPAPRRSGRFSPEHAPALERSSCNATGAPVSKLHLMHIGITSTTVSCKFSRRSSKSCAKSMPCCVSRKRRCNRASNNSSSSSAAKGCQPWVQLRRIDSNMAWMIPVIAHALGSAISSFVAARNKRRWSVASSSSTIPTNAVRNASLWPVRCCAGGVQRERRAELLPAELPPMLGRGVTQLAFVARKALPCRHQASPTDGAGGAALKRHVCPPPAADPRSNLRLFKPSTGGGVDTS
mmetsp:Transcript_115335/g.333184  ORF Transcript_115335/g.333184 Transcript_115335/m.333184 type:complete len:284 (+) Transcript_115335:112-963(+)